MTPTASATDPRTWTDAHLHVWDAAALRAPWFSQAPHLAGRFDLGRYRAEGGVHGGVVLVEADMARADRAREARLLARWGVDAGIPFATIAGIEPGVEAFRSELEEIAPIDRVRGARRVLHSGDIPFGTTRFAEDLRILGTRGLVFDLCVRWADLGTVERTAREADGTALVLDHLGNPPIRQGWSSPERAEWQRLVARVAACGAMSVKWSAMFENAGRALGADEIRPWFEWCLTCFGPTRVLWGSNWPVCFGNARLVQWTEATSEIAGGLSADEQAAILGGNAARTYSVAAAAMRRA